ncbi:MAG: hypothetical protein E5Y89_02405 [Mesorhizobium sp.]|nr:MAG: hypothetical protein E5Y89_02405 [Mesorhizobium sp.]
MPRPKMVCKYIERGSNSRPVARDGCPNKIAPFADYLRTGLNLSAVRLTREIRVRGYDNAYTAVKRFVAAIRLQERVRPFEVRFEAPAGHQDTDRLRALHHRVHRRAGG